MAPVGILISLVALFTRAWIEIRYIVFLLPCGLVALFTRAWIEISATEIANMMIGVALFTRAWIEMYKSSLLGFALVRRPLYEGVD